MMHLLAGGSSMERQRQGDLMSGRIDVDQTQRTTRGREDRPARQREVANAHDELGAGATGTLRDATAVPELELHAPERDAPRRRPLEPTGAQAAPREVDIV